MTAIEPRPTGHVELSTEHLPASPETELIRLALERNLDVDKLEKLVALRLQMEDRDARRQFAAAMAAFQQECPSIKHERTAEIVTKAGGKYKYTYAELDVIARTVNPILAKHGLSYRWDTTVERDTLTVTCVVTHAAGHAELSRFALPIDNPSAMSAQQKVGAAATFAKRQSLTAALGLTTTDDDTDGAEQDHEPIAEDQVTQLQDVIDDKNIDLAKFLAYMGVASLAQIRAADYTRAMQALRQAKARAS